ncbi:unnamed protein product [Peniophora sp. CBMAI 1063]|nr:unnamed protein product [Peniophora sp. CBMAI 1063]
MRSSGLTTIVCLAVAVIASPTPIDPDSLQARDGWSPPVRRDVFTKRTPEPEPEAAPELFSFGKRSPFALPNVLPRDGQEGTVTLGKRTSDGGGRLPFFFKRDGKLSARDIEAMQARKAEIEKREAELVARELEELARREAEELAKREAEEFARREAEELQAREASSLKKREAFEEIEARQAELELAKREYEEAARREYEEVQLRDSLAQFGMRDIEAREPLSFTVTIQARDVDDGASYLAKRAPQFNIASLISQLTGNATANGGAGGGANANTGLGRLSALTNGRLGNLFGGGGTTGGNTGLSRLGNLGSALNRFGFNFRREEELARELAGREASPFPFSFKDDSFTRREPFDFDSFVKAKRWN